MILGIGVDVVRVERIRRWKDVPGLCERYFHPNEIATARRNGKTGILSLAARFAAKEAFGKAVGTGLGGFGLKEIEVVNDLRGRPEFILSGKALEVYERMRGRKIHVSLTHEEDNAIAMVVIEG